MDEKNNEECYVNSVVSVAKKLESGGYGSCCCIPLCTSSFYDKNKRRSGIGLFKFPVETSMRRKWLSVISIYRRKGGADQFKVTNATRICEFHFKSEEIRVSKGIGRKTLVPGSVPSVFTFRQSDESEKSVRKLPPQRLFRTENEDINGNGSVTTNADHVVELETQSQPEAELSNGQQGTTNPCEQCSFLRENIEFLENENDSLQMELQHLRSECSANAGEKEEIENEEDTHIYSYEIVSMDKHHFKSATGLELEVFDCLFTFLNPGANCENIKYYDTKKSTADTPKTSGSIPEKDTPKKRGPHPSLNPINQLFLLLVWLKNGFSLSHTAWLFHTPKSTVSRYIITWVNFLYFSLGSLPIWPTKQQVQETMPDSFKRAYPTTRCIIDCTELFCQSPSSLNIQNSLFSHYKHHVTYKGLIGIAPSGAITFISQLYSGSISDKEIVNRSGILRKELWDDGDSIMADRGFIIEDELKALNVQLNIPAFLDGREQLTKGEVKESQSIASVRIHVERAIQRVKKFRQLRNEIPLVLHGSINQIWTVACLLCNFLPPLIQSKNNS